MAESRAIFPYCGKVLRWVAWNRCRPSCPRRRQRGRHQRRERIKRRTPPGLVDPLTCREVRLGTGACDGCELRTRGVEYHFFGPLMVRTDPQVHPLIRRDFRMRGVEGSRQAPVSDEQRRDENASHPRKILTCRHGKGPQRGRAAGDSRQREGAASAKECVGSIAAALVTLLRLRAGRPDACCAARGDRVKSRLAPPPAHRWCAIRPPREGRR